MHGQSTGRASGTRRRQTENSSAHFFNILCLVEPLRHQPTHFSPHLNLGFWIEFRSRLRYWHGGLRKSVERRLGQLVLFVDTAGRVRYHAEDTRAEPGKRRLGCGLALNLGHFAAVALERPRHRLLERVVLLDTLGERCLVRRMESQPDQRQGKWQAVKK